MAVPTFRVGAAQRTIARLARDIGPREATSPSFERAARFVERRLVDLGYTVRDQSFTVPAGTSWGVPVPSGQTRNVVAVAPGTDRDQPHLVVGAHLDTVPQAPGAVDDASGIAIVLEIARMARLQPPPYPVVFVAFAAEEPRGPGDDLHHFGSQEYVRQLTPAQRRGLIGAVAIDSVGVSRDVPVCSATETPGAFVRGVRTAVRDAGLPVRSCVNRTSDHWSFVRNGLAGVRVGLAGTQEYAEYHSARDTVDVVDPAALATAGQAVWAALQRA
jgi:Zn-dependent M28 family amino/carboxypeptidase